MKLFWILVGTLLLGAITWAFVIRPQVGSCRCGEGLEGLEPVPLVQLLEKPDGYLKKEVRVEGIVARQCPCCTCWLVIRDAAGRELKVEAGELGQPLPYRPGRKASVGGQLIRFGEGYQFVATAVEIE